MFAITAAAIDTDDPLAGLRLGDHPDPVPPDGWVVVNVRAASLNHHDLWTLKGVGVSADRLPIVLGCDASGLAPDGRPVIVHAVIGTVDGDETLAGDFSILSEIYDGTLAAKVAVPARNLVDMPASLSFEEASCLPTAWLTAYRMLFTRAELKPGQRVLVQGAGGGVATAALLLARAAGAHVTVTSRTADKLARASDLGAHEVVATGERLSARVDVVVETVGAATWSHSLKALAPGGTVVVAGATSGPNPPADLARVFYRQLRVVGSTMGTRTELARLVAFLDATGVRPVIDEVMPMNAAQAAFSRLHEGDVFGKVVLTAG
ncbi:MAG: zinc-binding dehydrogenase [Nitriliruptoraceae bacterium]